MATDPVPGGGARKTRNKDLKRIDPKAVEGLLADLQSHRVFSDEELKELASRKYSQPVVSLYLDLLPASVEGSPDSRLKLVNSMRHSEMGARSYLLGPLSASQKTMLEHDLDELELLVEQAGNDDGNRSLVAFKSARDLSRAAGLRLPTEDRLVIDVDPYLVPLEILLESRPQALVVEVGKEASTLSSWRFGELRSLRRLEAPPHPATARIGGGKEEEHREAHLHRHLKATSELTGKLLARHNLEHLVLAGEEHVLAEFEPLLHETVAARIVGRVHRSAEAGRDDWERTLEAILQDHRRSEEEAALDRLGEYRGHGLLRSGLAASIEVANLYLLRRLFVSASLRQPGRVCPEGHHLSLDEERCPLDSRELLPVVNVVDDLIEFAKQNGVELMVVAAVPERLDPYEGIAAVTFDLDQSAATKAP